MRSVEMVIDRDLAREWLEKRFSKQRHVTQNHVYYLKGVLQRGEWELNGEAIKFDVNGELIDGQHRLLAIAETGIPIKSLVCFDVTEKAFETLDKGKIRTDADVLSTRGEKNTNLLAAALRLIYREGPDGRVSNKLSKPSRQQVLEILDENQTIRDSVDMISNNRNYRTLMPSSIAAYCHYKFGLIDTKQRDQFFREVSLGENLMANSATYQLRQRLLNNKLAGNRMKPDEILAVVIKGWNYFRKGRAIQNLRWHASQEDFPIAC
jgi:hypothetical protein